MFKVAIQRSRSLALLVALVIVLAFGSVGALLWIGAHDVFAGRLSAGSLTAFIFYAVIVANATFVLAEVYGELQRAAGASERLIEILETESRIRAPREPKAMPAPQGRVAFERDLHDPRGRDAPLEVSRSRWSRARSWPCSYLRRRQDHVFSFSSLLRSHLGRVVIDGVDARGAERGTETQGAVERRIGYLRRESRGELALRRPGKRGPGRDALGWPTRTTS